MKIAMMIFLLTTAAAWAGDTPIGWPEQQKRLLVGETNFTSPICGQQMLVASLKINITRDGEVKKVEENDTSRRPKVPKGIFNFFKREVLRWVFQPVRVGGKLVNVETRPIVSCSPIR